MHEATKAASKEICCLKGRKEKEREKAEEKVIERSNGGKKK